jgi:hypothetical protein
MSAELLAFLETVREDPVAWARAFLPDDQQPDVNQIKILRAVQRGKRTAVVAARGAGKTRAAAICALWFLTTRVSLVFTCLPIWNQAEAFGRELKSLWGMSRLSEVFGKDAWDVLNTEINNLSDPKWRAVVVASKESGNIEGFHAPVPGEMLLLLDESKSISDEFFLSMLGMHPDRTLAISTAGLPRGWFKRAFYEEAHLWDSNLRISARDVPRLQKDLAEMERNYGGKNSARYKQDVEGLFTAADEQGVLDYNLIDEAAQRNLAPPPGLFRMARPCVAGVDVAGHGPDESVFSVLIDDKTILPQEVFRCADSMETAARIVRFCQKYCVGKVAIDSAGMGKPIYDRVAQLMQGGSVQVLAYNGAHSPKDKTQWANLKSEMIAGDLRKRLIEGNIAIPNEQKLLAQLAAYQLDLTVGGKTRVRDSGSDSLDRADSLVIALWAARKGESGIRWVKANFI